MYRQIWLLPFSIQVYWKEFQKGIQVWRPVRESNPCRRRESEGIYKNSKETCGMDSTVVNGILRNRYWTPDGRAVKE